MNKLFKIFFTIILLVLSQSTAQEIKNVTDINSNGINITETVTEGMTTVITSATLTTSLIETDIKIKNSSITIENPSIEDTATIIANATKIITTPSSSHNESTISSSTIPATTTESTTAASATTVISTSSTTTTTTDISPLEPYCTPSLCELFDGTHIQRVQHIACNNHGNFGPVCGSQPHLLYMSERRRNLILDLHNLARSRIAAGHVDGYKSASHMPQLKWDSELEYLASLHAKRCKFAHDLCRNTPRFEFSGQNIGYFWIRRDIKSHSRRMKNFIVNWFKEHTDANQTFIDSYYPHPEGKKIGHFTLLVADRVHRVGCAAIRFREPDEEDDTKFLMTCNYDFTNILGEPIYQSGSTASKCSYKISEKYPALCDWKDAVYDYDSEESSEDNNLLDSNVLATI